MEKSCLDSGSSKTVLLRVLVLVVIKSGSLATFSRCRITEISGVNVSLDPKTDPGDCNGAGAHCNYITKSMRNDGGLAFIKKAIEKLQVKHKQHITAYGEGSEVRLTGKHEPAYINTFSSGVVNVELRLELDETRRKKAKVTSRIVGQFLTWILTSSPP